MIALYACARGSNEIWRIDDPTLTTDGGGTFITDGAGTATTPFYVTGAVDQGPAGRQGRLRRAVQAVAIGANTTVKITPIVDGAEVSAESESFALVTTAGPVQLCETFPSGVGTRFQLKVSVTAIAGPVSFGECDMVMVPKRSTTSN